MFAGNFPPNGWMFCNGQLIPISENDALFTLIGTTYGGDGQETFALPNLQSRVPVHPGSTIQQAETGGTEEVTLTVQQMPSHKHPWLGTTDAANSQDPTSSVVATTQAQTYFNTFDAQANFSPLSVGTTGGSQPHSNIQPYGCLQYIISLFGVFPTQT
jgi:microcystin-dependent protein